MKKFLFYDNVFNQEELDLTWEELNKTDWGRLDDPIFGNRDVINLHGPEFYHPPFPKLIDSYLEILEEQTKDALQNGLQRCQGRIICDEKLARYAPGDDLDWHCGDWAYYNHPYLSYGPEAAFTRRQLTSITYLNDDYVGGETEFTDDILIKPETGKTLIFPAHWEFAHKGRKVVEGTKYVYINHIWF